MVAVDNKGPMRYSHWGTSRSKAFLLLAYWDIGSLVLAYMDCKGGSCTEEDCTVEESKNKDRTGEES